MERKGRPLVLVVLSAISFVALLSLQVLEGPGGLGLLFFILAALALGASSHAVLYSAETSAEQQRSIATRLGWLFLSPIRAMIQDAWIERAIREPIRQAVQADGRIRRWAQIPEADGRYLRVVLLEDGETVHNAFFDRGFVP